MYVEHLHKHVHESENGSKQVMLGALLIANVSGKILVQSTNMHIFVDDSRIIW